MKEKIYIPVKIEDNKITIDSEATKKMNNNKGKKIILNILSQDFTSMNIDKQNEILLKLKSVIKRYKIFGIKITAKPSSLNKEKFKVLKKNKVKELEIYIDSSNDYILKNIKADYNFEEAKKIIKKIKSYRFNLNINIVIGLPESTLADDLNTVRECIKLRPIQIRLIPCVYNYNEVLNELYEHNEFEPLSEVQLIERIKEILNYIEQAKVENIVVGEDNQTIYGMSVNKFRDLLEGDIWYEKIVDDIKSFNVKVKEVEIEANPEDTKAIKGVEDKNLIQLRDVYDVELKIVNNEKIHKGDYKIKILKTYTDFLDDEDN